MTRALLERCLTKWLEDADPAECVDLVEAIRAHLAQPQREPVAAEVSIDEADWRPHPLASALRGNFAPGIKCRLLFTHPAHTEACKWTLDESDMGDTYASACGELWSFIDGGPVENRVKFCQGCGRPVKLGAPA